ncbi:MAG: 30S ribosomal protein S6 [Candidatus Melainabacteria bacterium]|jgi:small subunit ribosomal protein S6|nr:30S ribosomal protein S6 [Candidatus Melainabacteria bacterium]MBX9674311.1 30S ribosomal protein S6 [Candidatus Obscuribacterales bacterium]
MTEKKPVSYETMFIIRPNLDEDAVDRSINAVEEFIKAQGGSVDSVDKKGRKRLAYEVNKMRDGYYVVISFKAKPDSITAIKRMMTLSEDIIRSLIVVVEASTAQKA